MLEASHGSGEGSLLQCRQDQPDCVYGTHDGMRNCLGSLLGSFVVCGRLVTTTTCTLLITPPPGYCATPYWNSQPRKTGLSIMGFYHADTVPIMHMHDVNNVLVVC